MPIPNLTIIGESINDSVPSTKQLFDANNLAGLLELARSQDEKGAAYLDVNIGARPPEFMAELVRKIQSVTAKPLSIDTPDPQIARAGLEAYDPAGRRPAADHQFHQPAADGDVRSVCDPALPPHPLGFRAGGRRRVEAMPHCGRNALYGPADCEGFPRALSRRGQRRLHHRSRHRPHRQRHGGQPQSPDRR